MKRRWWSVERYSSTRTAVCRKHEAHTPAVEDGLQDVAGKRRSLPVLPVGVMPDGATFEPHAVVDGAGCGKF